MRVLFAAALLAGTVAGLATADAAQGCGRGFHRGPLGGCVVNEPAVVVGGPVVVVPGAPVKVCPIGFVWRYGRCRPI